MAAAAAAREAVYSCHPQVARHVLLVAGWPFDKGSLKSFNTFTITRVG